MSDAIFTRPRRSSTFAKELLLASDFRAECRDPSTSERDSKNESRPCAQDDKGEGLFFLAALGWLRLRPGFFFHAEVDFLFYRVDAVDDHFELLAYTVDFA